MKKLGMIFGTGVDMANYRRRTIVMMGKVFSTAKAAAEAIGMKYTSFKVQMHFWRKADCPPWFVEILLEDSENQEMIDAAVVETATAARRLYALKLRVIQADYDKRMAELNKEYCLLGDEHDD